MTSGWVPRKAIDLSAVLASRSVGGVRVGDSTETLDAQLGPAASVARVNRKGTIWAWQYGNVTMLVSDRTIVGIEIDFEGRRAAMVEAGTFGTWDLPAWERHAREQGWTVESSNGVVRVGFDGGLVSLEPEGTLHLVSLRPRTAP